MRRPTRSVIFALVTSVLLTLGVGVMGSPAMASTVTPTTTYNDPTSFLNGGNDYYSHCGRHWPSEGMFEVYKSGAPFWRCIKSDILKPMDNAYYIGSFRDDGLNGPNRGWIVGTFMGDAR